MLKTVGIIGAMAEELEYISQNVSVVARQEMAGMEFAVGKFLDLGVVLVQSGIGKVNAAICAQVLIDCFAVDEIICIGVAGGVHPDLEIGDTVISVDTVQHDMDVSIFGDPVGVIPNMEKSIFPADRDMIEAAVKAGETLGMRTFQGRIGSGDQFISKKEDKERIWKQVKAHCVEMEGAAIAQTCYLNHIPFVILRAISDKAEGCALHQFETFKEEAAGRAGKLIEETMRSLNTKRV